MKFFVYTLIAAVVMGLGKASGEKGEFEVGECVPIGSEWVKCYPGVITSSASATFHYGSKRYKVLDSMLPDFKEWALRNIYPLLSVRPKDEGQFATDPEFSLYLYGDKDSSSKSIMLAVPLADVFKGFSEKEFERLVLRWCTVK